MSEKKLGFLIFKGCSYICIVFAIISMVTLNFIGAIGWTISSGILNILAKKLENKAE